MANYEVLEPGGHAALIDGLKDYTDREGGVGAEQIADGSVNLDKLDEDVLDVLDTKADIDGYYAQLTAGAADNLTGRGDATTAEFLYRTAGGTADIETGQAVAKSIKGNTLVWNQLSNSVWPRTQNVSGLTITVSDNTISAHGTVGSDFTAGRFAISENIALKRDGRKYLFMANKDLGHDLTLNGYIGARGRNGFIWSNTAGTDWQGGVQVVANPEDVFDFDGVKGMIFDLTQMFGAGNEPSTVAEFEALFPEPYYEYDAGSLLSVNMEGIETVGFNQLPVDPVYDTNVKTITLDKSKAAHLIAGQEYRYSFDGISGATSWRTLFKVFDSSGKEVVIKAGTSMIASGLFSTMTLGSQWMSYNTNNNAFITGSDSAIKVYGFTPTVDMYMMVFFTSGNTSSASVIQNPCLHLVWSGRRNGEYEAFWKSQRLIDVASYFPDGMRSAGSVYDELTSTEAITRVGVLDSTSGWSVSPQPTVNEHGISYAEFSVGGTGVSIELNASKIIANIPIGKGLFADATRREFAFNGAVVFYRYPTSTPSLSAALADMQANGAVCFYQLATPIVTPIDPALNLSYRVDDFGTERIMVPEDERSAPPVLDIAYGLNVVDFVRRAPSEYISHASMSQFRLALMSHFGIFINETWDEVDNRYKYTITSE